MVVRPDSNTPDRQNGSANIVGRNTPALDTNQAPRQPRPGAKPPPPEPSRHTRDNLELTTSAAQSNDGKRRSTPNETTQSADHTIREKKLASLIYSDHTDAQCDTTPEKSRARINQGLTTGEVQLPIGTAGRNELADPAARVETTEKETVRAFGTTNVHDETQQTEDTTGREHVLGSNDEGRSHNDSRNGNIQANNNGSDTTAKGRNH